MSGEASSTVTRQRQPGDVYASTSDEDEGLTGEVERGSLSYGHPRLGYFPCGNYAMRWKRLASRNYFQSQPANAK